MTNRSIDTNGPPVYLCQVSPQVSCGACCGLYNVADPSHEGLEALLLRRTRWFAEVPRTVAALDDFKARVEAAEPQERPFPEFHHCAFLGLIEDDGRRVGCLLHPLAKGNDGVDWRGLSHYGGMACRTYFCPSVRQLPARWLAAVRASMNHWHLHGLIVTERRLLAAFFMEVEKRLGRTLADGDFVPGSRAVALFRQFAALKIDWPHRRAAAPGPPNYFFEDGLYPRPAVWRTDDAIPASPLEPILRELDSGFASAAELSAAEERINGIIDQMVSTLVRN